MDNNISIGNSGEYFVAGELERRGFTVALPLSNVKDFDILAIDRNNHGCQFAIQVKTTTKNDWILGKKNEDIIGDNIIYILVKLNGLNTPEYHIIPSKVIAETIKKGHQEWLKTTGKKGNKHKDSNIRKYYDVDNKYLNNWDIFNE
jgi:hypothetical protein